MQKTFSKERPNLFSVNKLAKDLYEISIYENINEVQLEGENGVEVSYECDLKTNRVEAKSKDELKGHIIILKYGLFGELSLSHKGIENPLNEKYVEYREFANLVKQYVDENIVEND